MGEWLSLHAVKEVEGGETGQVCVYLGPEGVLLGEVCMLEVCHLAWLDVDQAVLISSHR